MRAFFAAGAALLTLVVWHPTSAASLWAGSPRSLALLSGSTLLWATAAWARRRYFAPENLGTATGSRKPGGCPLLFLVWGAALAPYASRHAIHLAYVVLAATFAWLVWPGLWRLGEKVRAAPAWPRLATELIAHAPLVVFVTTLLLVFVQSYRRHLWFGSAGKDLGLFHQSIWLMSRFEAPYNTLLGMNAFADHLELIDVLVVPLMWVWPDAGALLLFQAVCVASGAVAVFDLARRHLGGQAGGWAMVLCYVLAIDMQNAVMFDWNPTTCGAGLLPWVVWTFERGRTVTFALALALVAACKENLVLYALALCLTLALELPRRRRTALVAAAVLATLFVFEMKVLFPLLRDGGFRHLRYEGLGASAAEITITVLTRPWYAVSLLWTPASKVDGLLSPLSSVAFAIVLAPRWLLALAPMVLERFWSSHQNRWWGFHYGAGAAVIAVLGSVHALAWLRHRLGEARRVAVLGLAVTTVTASTLIVACNLRSGPDLLRWHRPYHTTPEDRRDAHRALAVIPDDAPVAAQNHLLPHLSARRELYELHEPVTARFVALDFVQGPWPFDRSYIRALARRLLLRGYGVVACEGAAVVLERDTSWRVPCPALDAGAAEAR